MSRGDHEGLHIRIDDLRDTLNNSLSELTTAVKTLVKHETEHKATVETLARYGLRLEDHDNRIDVIEKKTPLYDLMVKSGLAIAGTILTLILIGVVSSYFMFGGVPAV